MAGFRSSMFVVACSILLLGAGRVILNNDGFEARKIRFELADMAMGKDFHNWIDGVMMCSTVC